MRNGRKSEWQNKIVNPAQVMKKLEPGMSIFLGTGVGEPRTLVKHLMSTDSAHLKDLELIQVAVDVSRQAMEQESLIVGEPGHGHIIKEIPRSIPLEHSP